MDMDILKHVYGAEPYEKLKLEDISVGMRVHPSQLRNIKKILILLTDPDKDNFGTIIYIGDIDTKEAEEMYDRYDALCIVYNNEDGVDYE